MEIPQLLENFIFISKIFPGEDNEISSLLLAESIREFSGTFEHYPIWFLHPGKADDFSERTINRLDELDVKRISIQPDNTVGRTFFHWEINTLGKIETLVKQRIEFMAWMDFNTLVLKPPDDLILQEKIRLGYKPVHHLLIGSKYDQPVNPFWEEIYKICDVKSQDIFPMNPIIEDLIMRPYFNAGFLVSRPKDELYKNWSIAFQQAINNPTIQSFLEKDPIYNTFLHQAILSGVIIHQFSRDELLEMPSSYNYPLHLWDKDQTERKPIKLDECNTIRHEGITDIDSWFASEPFNQDITKWLKERLEFFRND